MAVLSCLLTQGEPIHVQVEEGVFYGGCIFSIGSMRELRTYALFEKTKDIGGWKLFRTCNKKERRWLEKVIYAREKLKSVRSTQVDGEPCIILVAR